MARLGVAASGQRRLRARAPRRRSSKRPRARSAMARGPNTLCGRHGVPAPREMRKGRPRWMHSGAECRQHVPPPSCGQGWRLRQRRRLITPPRGTPGVQAAPHRGQRLADLALARRHGHRADCVARATRLVPRGHATAPAGVGGRGSASCACHKKETAQRCGCCRRRWGRWREEAR